MITRRTFLSLLATTAVAPDFSWAQAGSGRVALYASVGPTLTHDDVDVPGAALSGRSSVTLPANVPYAWPHVSRQYLYVASSNSAPGLGGVVGNTHHVSTFRLDGAGALTPHGIHCRTFHIDPSGRMLVAAHIRPMFVREGAGVRHVPACLSVFRIGQDGKLDFVRTYDVDVGNHTMFWMGMVKL